MAVVHIRMEILEILRILWGFKFLRLSSSASSLLDSETLRIRSISPPRPGGFRGVPSQA